MASPATRVAAPARLTAALAAAQALRPRHVRDVVDLVAFPTVSAQPRHAGDLVRAAAWLSQRLREVGLPTVRVIETSGHPVVFAASEYDPHLPTLLVYGHYDVQPAEPFAAWSSPPFTATRTAGTLVGRGVSDNKGQLLAHVAAWECWYRTLGRLPVNVRCLLDGEEEIGSPNLAPVIERTWGALRPDAAIISDTSMRSRRVPALVVSLRGSLHLEVELTRPGGNLHSGAFGGAVAEPARELCALLTSLHRQGRLTVADAPPPSPRERAAMAATGPEDIELLAVAGAAYPGAGTVDREWTAYERVAVRPALVVTSLSAGYAGSGHQSAIPAVANARLNVRLVPGQEPDAVERALRAHFESRVPAGLTMRVTRLASTPAVSLPRTGPLMRAARGALRAGFGRAPALLRSGGTIPVVSELAGRRGVPTVLMGFALPDDRKHAPNEQLSLGAHRAAIDSVIVFLDSISRITKSRRTGTRPEQMP